MFQAITKRLQTKLTLAFVLVMLIPVAVIVTFNTITYRNTLIQEITQQEISYIQTQANLVGERLETIENNTLFLSQNPDLAIYVNSLAINPDFESLARIHDIFTAFILNNPLAVKDVRILDRNGLEVVRVDNSTGTPIVISRNELENKADRPYYVNTITLPAGGIYISGFDLNETQGAIDVPYLPVIRYATPLYNNIDAIAGVLVVKIFAEPLIAPLLPDDEGEITYIIDTDGSYLSGVDETQLYGSILGTDSRFATDSPNDAAFMSASDSGYLFESQNSPDRLQTFVHIQPAGQEAINWLVIHAQPASNLYNTITGPVSVQIIISFVATVVAIVSALFIARTIVTPVRQLATAAKALGEGQKNVTVPDVNTGDEIGELAQSFNTMSRELSAIYESLEERIAARTADLEASAEIAGAANQVHEVGDLLNLAVNLIRDRFNFYYVQVYLVQGDHAVLSEGTGYVGRRLLNKGHRLPLNGRSLVASTINDGKPQVVQDTKSDPNFLPNELLPDTRAELTIPLRTKEAIVGVLDIQHNAPNAFDESGQRLFQAMADQLAVTFENVNLFESAQRRALELQTVAEVSAAAAGSLDTYELLKQVADLTKTRFNRYHAQFYLVDGDNLVLEAGAGEAGRIMKESGHTIPINREQSLVARAARSREGVIINNVTSEEGFLANPLLPETKAEMALPLVAADELIGVMDIQDSHTSAFNFDDLRIIGTLADQIAIAVQNARAFEQSRQQEQRFRSLVTNIPNTIYRCLFDEAWTMLFLSESMAQLTGYPVSDFIGNRVRSYNSIIYPEDVEMVDQVVREAVNNRTPYAIIYRIVRADGDIRWVEERGQAAFDEAGNIEWLDGSFADISDRREGEEERNILAEVSNRLVAATTRAELAHALSINSSNLRTVSVSLLYINNDEHSEPESLTMVATSSEDDSLNSTMGTTYRVKELPLTRLWLSNPDSPLIIEDVTTDPRVDPVTRMIYQQSNTRSSVVLPLKLQDRWVGVAAYTWQYVLKFDDLHHRIFTGIMERATLAVDAARSTENIVAAQEEANLLYEISKEINAAKDEAELVDVVVRHLVHPEAVAASLTLWDGLDFDTTSAVNVAARWSRDGNVQRPMTIPLSQFPFVKLFDRHDVGYYDDITTDDRVDPVGRETFLKLGYQAVIFAPLTVGERWIGSIGIYSGQPYVHDQRMVRLLRGVTEQMTAAVERLYILRQAERRAAELATVAEVSAATTSQLNVEELLQNVSDLTKESFDLYHAHVYLLDDANETLVLAAGAGEAGRTMRSLSHSIPLDREQSIVARAARTGQGVIANDVTSDEHFLANPLLPETKSELAVPMIIGDKVIGVLDVQASVPNRFSADDVRVQSTLADQIAVAVQNARAFENIAAGQEALNEQRTFLQYVIDNIPSAVFVKDYDGQFVLANQAQAAMFLTTPTELVGKSDSDFNPNPEEIAAFLEADRQVMDTGEPMFILEEPVTNLEGVTNWYQTSKVPLNSGESKQVLGVVTNITERKLAGEEREILAEVSTQLVSAQNRDDIVQAFSFYGERMNTISTTLMYIHADARGEPESLEMVASWRADRNPTPMLGRTFRLADFPFSKLWMSDPGNPIVIEDVETDPRLDPTTRAMQRSSALSAVILPLNLSGRWIGLIIFSWQQAQQFTDSQRRIFTGIMERATLAIDAARATEAIAAARQESELLYEISKQINAAKDEQELLNVIIKHVSHDEASVVDLDVWDDLDFDHATLLHNVAHWARDGSPTLETIPIADLPFAALLDRNQVQVCDDVENAEYIDEVTLNVFHELGIGAYVFAPLVIGKRWLGVMGVYSPTPHTHDDQQIRLLRGVTEQLTAAVDRLYVLRQAEQRATELATVARVSAATTTLLDMDELLRSVCELTKESFDLYHAHIYLLDDAKENLVLAAGAGEAGRLMKEHGHTIPMNREQSLVARAARTRQGIVSNDVMQEPSFLANPLLPDTRSELVIPLIIGNEVLGVLDTQSDVANHFTEQDLMVKATLADQIAIAVNNARIYEVERQSAEHLREADRLKSQFLANMSHELRTPLNSIIGYSEVLLDGVDGDLPDDAIEDVEAIHDSGKHLLALINEILDMAKIDAGQLHLDRKNNDLSKIVAEVMKVGQSLIKDKPLTVEVTEDEAVPQVYVDALRVRQILLNLVGNAVKFTEKGTITISYGLHNKREVYLRVRDTGVGISDENLKVVFERFRQVDGSSTRRAGGTGLGLSITQQLVQLHGGEIYAESEPGIGSTFWFTLPIAETQLTPAEVSANGKH